MFSSQCLLQTARSDRLSYGPYRTDPCFIAAGDAAAARLHEEPEATMAICHVSARKPLSGVALLHSRSSAGLPQSAPWLWSEQILL